MKLNGSGVGVEFLSTTKLSFVYFEFPFTLASRTHRGLGLSENRSFRFRLDWMFSFFQW